MYYDCARHTRVYVHILYIRMYVHVCQYIQVVILAILYWYFVFLSNILCVCYCQSRSCTSTTSTSDCVRICVLSFTCIQYVCQLIFSGNILHYCVHCTLHVGCCSKSLSESSGSEVYTDPLPRLDSKRSCSEGSMGESSHATVEGMYMCARSLLAYHVCIGSTFIL